MKLSDDYKIAIGITLGIVGVVLSAEIASYFIFNKFEYDYFSPTLGLITWFFLYFGSQDIVNKNFFIEVFLISISVIIISFFKQALTLFNYFTLSISALPLLFVIYFRGILFLFYNNYTTQKPVIVFLSRSRGIEYEGQDMGYKLSAKDVIFSIVMFMGFMNLCFGILIFFK